MFAENIRMCSQVAQQQHSVHHRHNPCSVFKSKKSFKCGKINSWQDNNCIYRRGGNFKRITTGTTLTMAMMMRMQVAELHSPCVSRTRSTPARDQPAARTSTRTTPSTNSRMSSNLMFAMEEEAMDLWDPSAAFLWPLSTTTSSGEESNESLVVPPQPMWASEPQPPTTSHWSTIDEDTVLFGDYSDLGVDELYEEGVIVDSCLSSTNNSRFGDTDYIEEEFDGDHEEEQVHFFGTPDSVIVDQVDTLKEEPLATVKKEDEKEEKKAQLPRELLVKIGSLSGLANESVVSTPDVVNDVIMLECEGFFRKRQTGHDGEDNSILTEIEEPSSDNVIEEIPIEFADDDDNNEYGEYVVEFIDESLLEANTSVVVTAAEIKVESNACSEFEEDDKDEDYKPPTPKLERTRRSNTGYGGYEKKRGRPAKPLRTHLTPRELANLPPEAKLHKVQRFKNNEASRLSRFKRRQADLKLSEQCDMYESENKDLRRALKKSNRLHKQLRALVIGIKFAD